MAVCQIFVSVWMEKKERGQFGCQSAGESAGDGTTSVVEEVVSNTQRDATTMCGCNDCSNRMVEPLLIIA